MIHRQSGSTGIAARNPFYGYGSYGNGHTAEPRDMALTSRRQPCRYRQCYPPQRDWHHTVLTNGKRGSFSFATSCGGGQGDRRAPSPLEEGAIALPTTTGGREAETPPFAICQNGYASPAAEGNIVDNDTAVTDVRADVLGLAVCGRSVACRSLERVARRHPSEPIRRWITKRDLRSTQTFAECRDAPTPSASDVSSVAVLILRFGLMPHESRWRAGRP